MMGARKASHHVKVRSGCGGTVLVENMTSTDNPSVTPLRMTDTYPFYNHSRCFKPGMVDFHSRLLVVDFVDGKTVLNQ